MTRPIKTPTAPFIPAQRPSVIEHERNGPAYRCAVCGKQRAKKDMRSMREETMIVEVIGIIVRRTGVCRLCSGVVSTHPVPEKVTA